jgi:PilZ domain-containing protein
MALIPGANRRRSERVPTNLQMELHIESKSGKLRRKVTVLNMSLFGVGIRSYAALAPEQTVTLVPSERSLNVYPCRVVWVKPSRSELYGEAGLEFWAVAMQGPSSLPQERRAG